MRDFFYPIPIEGGRTYEMLLDVGTGRYISILTEPAGASVTIDGKHHGRSPIYNQYLPYGQHIIEARNGFLIAEETITVSAQDGKEALTKTMRERAPLIRQFLSLAVTLISFILPVYISRRLPSIMIMLNVISMVVVSVRWLVLEWKELVLLTVKAI